MEGEEEKEERKEKEREQEQEQEQQEEEMHHVRSVSSNNNNNESTSDDPFHRPRSRRNSGTFSSLPPAAAAAGTSSIRREPNTVVPLDSESSSSGGAASMAAVGSSSNNAAPSSSSSSPLHTASTAVNIVSSTVVNGVPASSPLQPAVVVDPMSLPVTARRTVLILMCVLKIATSYDAGAFSFSIGAPRGIAADLDIDSAQAGFLGSSVYLGNVVGCACCAWMFHRRSAKYLLSVGMLLHALFTALFALSSSFVFAVFARIGIGFTLSFVVVYSVVWADVFSPKAHATLWLAMLNIGVPVGTLFGFVMGGLVVNTAFYSWRWIFFAKTLMMMPMIVFMAHVDPVMVDDPMAGTASEKIATPHLDVWNSFLGNKLMILNVAGLSVLYFVVTGMQVFFTQYLREPPFSASVSDIMLSFGFTAVSAPIAGVALGGIAMDRYGNYREHPDRAADLGAVAATLAAIFGVFTTISTSVTSLSVHLWMMLFFGAAALPSAMGLIVASVAPDQKNAASSFANIMFNVWGYFAGPMFCGFVAQYAGSLRVAMGATLNMGWIGVLFFWWSSRVARGVVEKKAAPGGAAPVVLPPASPSTTILDSRGSGDVVGTMTIDRPASSPAVDDNIMLLSGSRVEMTGRQQ